MDKKLYILHLDKNLSNEVYKQFKLEEDIILEKYRLSQHAPYYIPPILNTCRFLLELSREELSFYILSFDKFTYTEVSLSQLQKLYSTCRIKSLKNVILPHEFI